MGLDLDHNPFRGVFHSYRVEVVADNYKEDQVRVRENENELKFNNQDYTCPSMEDALSIKVLILASFSFALRSSHTIA